MPVFMVLWCHINVGYAYLQIVPSRICFTCSGCCSEMLGAVIALHRG